MERLRNVVFQAVDVMEVEVRQEEIIYVGRGGSVTRHQQRHGRYVVVDHDDRVAVDAAVDAARRGQHVLDVHGGRRRVSSDVLHRLRWPRRRILAVRRRRHGRLNILVAVPARRGIRVN